jgi:FtsZ-interacting cell division protein YlmF
MGLLSKLQGYMLGVTDDDRYIDDETDMDDDDDVQIKAQRERKRLARGDDYEPSKRTKSYDTSGKYGKGKQDGVSLTMHKNGTSAKRTMYHSDTQRNSVPYAQMPEVVTTAPKSMNDATYISNYLHDKKIVVVNIEGIADPVLAQRMADFISGAAYHGSCEIKRVSKNIFIVADKNIKISTDIIENEIKAKKASGFGSGFSFMK